MVLLRFPLERLWVPCSLARCWGGLHQAGCVQSLGAAACSPLGVSLHSSWVLDGLLCVSDRHPLPAAFTSSPLSCLGSELGRTEAGLPGSLLGGCLSRPHWGGSFAARGSPGCQRAGLQTAGGRHCWLRWSLAVFSRCVSWRSVKSLMLSAWLLRIWHSPSLQGPGSGPAPGAVLSTLCSPHRARAPLQTLWQVLQPGGVHVSEGRAGWLGARAPLTAPCPQVQVRALPVPQRDAARADLPLERLQRDPRVSGVRPWP